MRCQLNSGLCIGLWQSTLPKTRKTMSLLQKILLRFIARTLFIVFSEHTQEGKCEESIRRGPLASLNLAFNSGQEQELRYFVRCDSDGLGHPLPKEAPINLALAAAYLSDLAPEYDEETLHARDESVLSRRSRMQGLRRAAKRLHVPRPEQPPFRAVRMATQRNSTIHLARGALVIFHWTRRWHYREQSEMLKIMGVYKGEDFVRDRVDYLRENNANLFQTIESWALQLKNQRI
jgi:hypothetical protein